nr:unnamed protein product [Spirometra erinaceieuropaei]
MNSPNFHLNALSHLGKPVTSPPAPILATKLPGPRCWRLGLSWVTRATSYLHIFFTATKFRCELEQLSENLQ